MQRGSSHLPILNKWLLRPLCKGSILVTTLIPALFRASMLWIISCQGLAEGHVCTGSSALCPIFWHEPLQPFAILHSSLMRQSRDILPPIPTSTHLPVQQGPAPQVQWDSRASIALGGVPRKAMSPCSRSVVGL